MIRSILFTQSGEIQLISLDQFNAVLSNKQDFLWVDIDSEPLETCKEIFQDIFNFHPLAIDDALHETHVPKVDDWDTYLYLVLRTVDHASDNSLEIITPELDIFLGSNYLVTYHTIQIDAVQRIWDFCQRDQRYLAKGAGYLLYQIADEIVTDSMALIENMDDLIDDLEDEIFAEPQQATLANIFSIKGSTLKMRRTLLSQREVFNKLARGDYDLIQDRDRIYFMDVYDHMVRLQEINESLRDLTGGALDIYLSVVNNRMNEIMKVLTIIATIFIPLSFLTGIYGMNFINMPELHWRWGYFSFLGFLGIVIIGMLIFFKRKRWI